MVRSSGRESKPVVLSMAAMATTAKCSVKVAPPRPMSSKMVACHSGDKENGKLKAFAKAPAWFRPNLTPREMLVKGMHGGIYWNPKGGKPGLLYPRSKFPNGIPGVSVDEFPKEWFAGVPKELYLSRRYSTSNNCYKVKSGLDQVGWESSGWINPCDPRGWTQWYFRFFQGRRLEGGEDERQMSRWLGVCGDKGRWKQNLIAKCMREGKSYDDTSVSPVVRQTLLHWAYELNAADFDVGAKRVKQNGAAYVPRDSLSGVVDSKGGGPSASVVKAEEDAATEKKAQEREERAKRRANAEEAEAEAEKPTAKRQRKAPAVKKEPPEAEPPTAYEQKRLDNMARNKRTLNELGLE